MFANKPSILFISVLNVCIFGTIQGTDDCPGCSSFTCNAFNCESDEVCLLKKFACVSDPCPKIPTCIKSSDVCKGYKKPLIDQTGGLVTCENSSCSAPNACVEDVCCSTATMPPLTNTVNTNIGMDLFVPGDGKIPPNFLEEKTGKPKEEKPCLPCPFSPCLTSTCQEPKDVHCVEDSCSCVMWFADHEGNRVECLDTGAIVNPFMSPPNVDHKPVTLEPTETSVKTLANVSDNSEGTNSWKYPVIAICAAVAICVVAFVVYKVVTVRQRKEDSKIQEEQKVPLKEVESSAENNNDSKPSKSITTGDPEIV